MITSFYAYRGGNGKTTMAINLAYALAEMDNKVLLMDCDSRAPALQDYLWELIISDRKPKKFYLDYLILGRRVKFDECIATIKIDGTSFDVVFLAPKHGIDPEKLLHIQRRQFNEISDEYRSLVDAFDYATDQGYSYILLDASPGYDICNLMLVASISEMIVLVTRAHKIDLEQTLLYNFLSIEKLLDLKREVFPLKQFYLRMIINEVKDANFTDMILEDIARKEKISLDEIEQSILGKVGLYEELRLDKDPSIFSALYPTHPFVEDVKYLAKEISRIEVESL